MTVTVKTEVKMKLFAPKYYKKFQCIADKCKHSCCVGWEIDVDDYTLELYRDIPGEIGEDIRKSIAEEDGNAFFRMCPDGKCPHLDESGLCRIIKALGDDALCDICREHPRFYNDVGEHSEVGLGAVCEEAARLILAEEDYATLEYVGETYGEPAPDAFDPAPLRSELFAILSDCGLTYPARLHKIAEKFALTELPDDSSVGNLLSTLEYLDESHRNLFADICSTHLPEGETALFCERFFAYLIYRHGGAATDAESFRRAVGFALILERLFRSLIYKHGIASAESARIISEELEYSEENTESIQSATK